MGQILVYCFSLFIWVNSDAMIVFLCFVDTRAPAERDDVRAAAAADDEDDDDDDDDAQ